METKLCNYIEGLFADAPVNRKTMELREEMLQNATEKYRDLLAEGKSEEIAYNIAVAGIGDISDLLRELERQSNPVADPALQKRSATLTAVAVMLYILSVVPTILMGIIAGGRHAAYGPVFMFLLIAAATGLLIYNNMTKPKYRRSEDTVVEEFKEWQSRNDSRKTAMKSIRAAIWSIVLALYFILSFATGAWYITWVLFLIAVAVQKVAKAVMDLTDRR